MNLTRMLKSTVGVAGLALVLAGCGGTSGSEDGAGGNNGTGASAEAGGECTADRVGGSVTMAMGSQPTGLDPFVVNGTPSTGGMEIIQIYDTLLQYDKETHTYEPRVAESIESNDEFDEWTVKIRPDITFGNGDPLDAAAVKASIERFQSEENRGTYRNLAMLITKMTVQDDSTIVFNLSEPWATFPFALANTPGMIVNTKVAEERGEKFVTDPSGAGVGPYEVTKFTPGEEIVLTAKDDYWGGPVCIETIRFIPMPTDSGKYEAFRAGELQAAWMREPLTIDQTQQEEVPAILTYQNAANVLILNSGVRGTEAPTTDVRVRQAIAHAIDVNAVDDRANEGTGSATNAILGENSGFFTGAEGLPYDRDKAGDLIAQAKADGFDGKINMLCAKGSEEMGLAVSAQLGAAGFDVEYESLTDSAAIVDRVIIKADFDVSCFGLNLIDEGLWPTMTNSLSSTSQSNYGGLQDPAIDELLSELRMASTTEEIGAAVAELQKRWNEVVPAVVLNSAPNATIYADNLHNLQPTSNSLVYFSDAYLS